MTARAYQEDARRTARDDLDTRERLIHASLGLAGESGEVVDLVKKAAYHDHPTDAGFTRKLSEELGDVLWYVAELATTLNLDIEGIMCANSAKRRQRYPLRFDPERSIHRTV